MSILRQWRWMVLIGVIATTAAAAACGMQDNRPPLTSSLNGPWIVIDKAFDRRVQTSFPVGSSVTRMMAELRDQGFAPEPMSTSANQEHEVVRREDSWVCRQAARVYWRADSDHLTAIRGTYREEGCL